MRPYLKFTVRAWQAWHIIFCDPSQFHYRLINGHRRDCYEILVCDRCGAEKKL